MLGVVSTEHCVMLPFWEEDNYRKLWAGLQFVVPKYKMFRGAYMTSVPVQSDLGMEETMTHLEPVRCCLSSLFGKQDLGYKVLRLV